MTSETFEQVLTAAEADGAFTPAWKKFVNTRFFVAVVRPAGADARQFTLHLAPAAQGGEPAVLISEVRAQLERRHGGDMATLSGAEVVRMLRADGAILVALSDRLFSIAKDRVDWLKKGIEAAQARAAAKAQEAAPAPVSIAKPAPAPQAAAPVSMAKPAPQAAPPVRRQGGVLDVAALKPRSVALPKVGLDFFVPGAWRDVQSAKGLQFADEASGTVLKASGMHRADLSLAKWQATNIALVQHEMRYLVQDGEPYAIDGDDWRDRLKGMATEFTGTFPGDDGPSRYLVACVRIDGTVAALTIRAPAEAFEQNRALYKWLLSRIDLKETAAIEARMPAAAARQFDDLPDTPGVFGLSLTGRISRLQALAYSFPVWAPFMAIMVLAAVIGPKKPVLAIAMGVSALVVTLWLALRLMVLRLHDVNISGKWIAIYAGLAVVAAVLRAPMLLGAVLVGGWVVSLVFYCLVPGTPDDNDYGPPPGENSMLVKIGAALFILLQVSGIAGQGKLMGTPGAFNLNLPSAQRGSGAGQMATFSPPDGSFLVDMPGQPEEAHQQLGRGAVHVYQVDTEHGMYVAQTIDYGSAVPDRAGLLDTLQATVVGDGTLIEAKPILLNGVKGREVRALMGNGMTRAARYVIVGAKIRMVIIMVPSGADGNARIEAYLDSFRLAS